MAVYAEHPSTEILCLSWKFKNTGEHGCWTPGMAFPQLVINHINQKGICEAHNVSAEFYIWLNKLYHAKFVHSFGVKYPLPPLPLPTRWVDTLATCAYRALPLALDRVGAVLDLDVQKNKRGKYLIQKLSKPRKPTKHDQRTRCDDYDLLEEMYDYCDRDVDTELLLAETLGDLPASEYKVWLLDQKINHRGLHIDTETVAAAVKIRDAVFETMGQELIDITEGQVMTGKQVAKMVEWLTQHGYAIDNLRKETVISAMENINKRLEREPDNAADLKKCIRVLELRQVLGNASSSKLNKFSQTVCRDGRCRGIQQYHGAGTGRWSGRLIQPHNFPRPTVTNKFDEEKKKWYLDHNLLIEHIRSGDVGMLELVYGNPLDAISTGLRSMVMAEPGKTLRVADFSAIEARGVMWLADETEALKAFRDYDKGIGPDIYCVMAEHLYERPINKDDDPEERGLGKVTILGAGYQMGPARMKEQAKDNFGIDITEEQSEWLIGTYRETYSKIPALWRGLEDAATSAIETEKPHSYRRITFDIINDAAGKWLICILPNGRRLWYYNPEMIETTTSWGAQKMSISYEGRDNKRGGSWQRVTTYGGMLCLAGDTEVLTDGGWKPLIDVTPLDRVHDGCEWVHHGGVLAKGEKEVIDFGGVRMTPDHEVLHHDGWIDAADGDHDKAVTLCETLGGEALRDACSSDILRTEPGEEQRMGMPVRLRSTQDRRSERVGSWRHNLVRMYDKFIEASRGQSIQNTWNVSPSSVLCLAVNAGSLSAPYASGMAQLWGQGYIGLHAMAGEIREFLGGYGSRIPSGSDLGSDRQRRELRARQLSMGNMEAAGKQPEKVYDLVNAGPQSRFVVRGTDKRPFIVHNCENVVQAISRDIMVEAMFRVEAAGYPIVLTVHDEVIAETPLDYGSTEEFEKLLIGPTPTWAKGFPINAEGWSDLRYRK